jgi:carbonyl reductase 1
LAASGLQFRTSRSGPAGGEARHKLKGAFKYAASTRAPAPRCIVTARDAVKGRAAADELRQEGGDVAFEQLDVTDGGSIRRLADAVATAHGGRLDALINNAGTAFKGDAWGEDVARTTIGTNFFGTAAVTEALLPFLRAAAAGGGGGHTPRIVNVCSQAGRLAQFSPELQVAFQEAGSKEAVAALCEAFIAAVADGSYASKGWPRSTYGVSKAAEIAYTFALAKELAHEGIEVQAVCPGYCSTSMSSFKGPRSAAKGAETPVWLALGSAADAATPLTQRTGGFWYDNHLIPW